MSTVEITSENNFELLTTELSRRIVKARAGIAYAINMMYGAELEDFERDNLIEIAKELGVVVSKKAFAFEQDRKILLEVLKERKKQVEIGYTPEKDQSNPLKLHQEIFLRVSETPSVHARQSYLEAAAILIAEIGVIDRQQKKGT